MGSIRISLTSPATLEHLKFDIVFLGLMTDFNFITFYENLRDAVAWNYLDSIINQPGGSQLQRVDININFSFLFEGEGPDPDEDKVLKALRDSLPLLCTKGILY
jgi:hypothetical protein